MTARPLPDSPARRFNARVYRENIYLTRDIADVAGGFGKSRDTVVDRDHSLIYILAQLRKFAEYVGKPSDLFVVGVVKQRS